MDAELLKYVWDAILTLLAGAGAVIWKMTDKRIGAVESRNSWLRDQITEVKVDYAKKDELDRIEHRIDERFREMREFFQEIVRKPNG